MNDFLTLLKYDFINSYNLNKFYVNKKNKKANYIIIIFFLFFLFYFLFSISFFIEGKNIGNNIWIKNYLLIQSIIIPVVLIFVSSLYRIPGILFEMKDFDFLSSLPIKQYKVILVKLINSIIPSYIIILFFFIPFFLFYYTNFKCPLLVVVYGLLMSLFIPLIPLSCSTLICTILMFFSNRYKYKHIVTLIVFLFITIILLYFKGIYMYSSTDIVTYIESFSKKIIHIYPPILFYMNGLIYCSIADTIIFIIISIFITIISLFVISRFFKVINSNILEIRKIKSYKKIKFKTNNILKILIINEFRKYISVPTAVLNTSYGLLIYLIFSIYSIIVKNKILNIVLGLPININNATEVGIIILISSFCIIVSNTTSMSLSLEGNKLWQLKVLPIKIKNIFLAKILMNFFTILPCIVVGTIILSIELGLDLKEIIFILIVQVIIATFFILLGVIVNTKYINLNWTSESMVVKRSISVFIIKLGGILFLFIIAIIYIKFRFNIYIYISIISLSLYIGSILCILLINKWCVDRFIDL